MKRIYITGIAGLLGGNAGYLLKNKYSIAGVDIININMDNVQTESFDMLDEKLLKQSLKRFKPDVVIHTVAAINVDKCEEDIQYAKKLNVILTQTVTNTCNELGIKLIYISTDAVFDGEKVELYDELDLTNPVNVYGSTKLEGEQIVLKNKSNLVLRTNIYGFNIQNKNSFGEWILYSLIENKTINMFDDINFTPILVNELANILGMAIEKDLSGLYNACGTNSISKYDFAVLIKDTFAIKSGVINKTISDTFPFKAKRSKNMGMSNLKLRNELNLKISTPKESIVLFKELYDNGYVKNLKEFVRSGENEN